MKKNSPTNNNISRRNFIAKASAAMVLPLILPGCATSGTRHVFIRNLELPAHIGVYRQEEGRTQPVRINVDLATEEVADAQDMLENVVDYHVIEKRIRAIIAEGHVRLAETLAERIAAACFEDARVHTVRVRVEKLEALTHAESVGIEIERTR